MGEPTINGDMPHSAFIDHVTGYPVVADSIEAIKKNPYAQTPIGLTNSAYANVVKPTFPYLEKPASIVKPYAAKADEIGDFFLTKFDEKVPIIKSETAEVKQTVLDYVHWPLKTAGEQKDYILKTYNEEYKKCGGDGVVAGSKALVSGSFVITSEWLAYFASLLQQKKEEAKKIVDEKTQEAKQTAEETKEKVDEKTSN